MYFLVYLKNLVLYDWLNFRHLKSWWLVRWFIEPLKNGLTKYLQRIYKRLNKALSHENSDKKTKIEKGEWRKPEAEKVL